jgi:hypothetical protein
LKVSNLLGRLLTCVATFFAVVLCSVAQASPVPGQGTWQTTLLGRDISGRAVAGNDDSAVFLYDSTLNITWLRNANVNGLMTWSAANAWASGYSLGGFDGWRLPTVNVAGNGECNLSYAGGTDCGFNVNTATSEMAHLFFDVLGNKAYCPPGDATCAGGPQSGWGLTNTGDFLSLLSYFYWSGTEYAPDTTYAWYFNTDEGFQLPSSAEANTFYALYVRPGDVLVDNQVPEPGSIALFGLAGVALGLNQRRRRAIADQGAQ